LIITTHRGYANASSDGVTPRIWLSSNWAGTIECGGPVVVHRGRRDRGWLANLLAWLRYAA
jgi:hypothetical protein